MTSGRSRESRDINRIRESNQRGNVTSGSWHAGRHATHMPGTESGLPDNAARRLGEMPGVFGTRGGPPQESTSRPFDPSGINPNSRSGPGRAKRRHSESNVHDGYSSERPRSDYDNSRHEEQPQQRDARPPRPASAMSAMERDPMFGDTFEWMAQERARMEALYRAEQAKSARMEAAYRAEQAERERMEILYKEAQKDIRKAERDVLRMTERGMLHRTLKALHDKPTLEGVDELPEETPPSSGRSSTSSRYD
jgi:hypothetical protein